VHDLRHKSKGLDRSRTDARREKELREIRRAAIGGGGEIAVQSAHMNIARPHIVVGRHHKMRKHGLRRRGRLGLKFCELADDPIRPPVRLQIKLSLAR